MPWDSDFYIGTSLDSNDFKKLSSLLPYYDKPVIPDWTFAPFSAFHDDLDGGRTGVGFPRATWKWNFRQVEHLEILRDLIPGLSELLYIRTPINAVDVYDAQIYRTFRCQTLWVPNDEDRQDRAMLGFTLEHRRLVLQAEIA